VSVGRHWRPFASLALLLFGSCAAAATLKVAALADMTLEQLANIEITSVSRRPEPLSTAAASVFVITAEDIRRSAANTLAEALRLAPNLDVARLDAGQYAISARGLNTNISNKLLVLVDGRTIYSPLFSGVFWDASDVMLEDVERIEVISGPGASQWGTNAVNGVINVITKHSRDTQGTLASAGLGEREKVGAAREGIALGENGTLRVYGKSYRADDIAQNRFTGASATLRHNQAGFRADWSLGADALTVQGDAYNGDTSDRVQAAGVDFSGANLLGRWTRRHSEGSSTQVQVYLDQTTHRDPLLLDENGETFDSEVRHMTRLGAHDLQLGAGYRHARDTSDPGTLFAFVPAQRGVSWSNFFLQDQIRLHRDVELTLGSRFERNDYTGWEALPTARLGWRFASNHFAWTSLSRAVRAPSRIDRDIVTPPPPATAVVTGGQDFQSEVAKVFELGVRGQWTPSLSYSATYFHQAYRDLRSAEFTNGGLPIVFGNGIAGAIDGVEGWGTLQVTPDWRLSAGGTHLHRSFHLEAGSTDPIGPANLGHDPDGWWMLRSNLAVRSDQNFDVMIRHTGSRAPLPPSNTIAVPDYTGVDLRYAWAVTRRVELALVASNLFDPLHREWGDKTVSSEIARSIFLRATIKL
jgi:iron complex outermembrane receptor protein